MSFQAFVAVGAGAACGAWLRWGLGACLNPIFPTLPLGTLAANLIGGFLMGVCLHYLTGSYSISPEVRLLVATGFLGGLTTFSTFSAEVVTFMLRGQTAWMFALVLAHLLGAVAMTLIGMLIMRWLSSSGGL